MPVIKFAGQSFGGEIAFQLMATHGKEIDAQLREQYGTLGVIKEMYVACDMYHRGHRLDEIFEVKAENVPVEDFWRTYHALCRQLLKENKSYQTEGGDTVVVTSEVAEIVRFIEVVP